MTRYSLPGDTAETVRAMHALNAAGLLKPNLIVGGRTRTAPCPRCGRDTAVSGRRPPSVCTGCRAESLAVTAPISPDCDAGRHLDCPACDCTCHRDTTQYQPPEGDTT